MATQFRRGEKSLTLLRLAGREPLGDGTKVQARRWGHCQVFEPVSLVQGTYMLSRRAA